MLHSICNGFGHCAKQFKCSFLSHFVIKMSTQIGQIAQIDIRTMIISPILYIVVSDFGSIFEAQHFKNSQMLKHLLHDAI